LRATGRCPGQIHSKKAEHFQRVGIKKIIEPGRLSMTQRRVDRERSERADREAKIAIEAERQRRMAKTARLRAERLAAEQAVEKPAHAKRRPAVAKKPARKVIEVE
jgi:hypothetical protein